MAMSLVTNTSSTLPYYVLPSPGSAAAQVRTAEDLEALSASDQVRYVEANGIGAPPALLLPTADGKGGGLASLAPSGNAVDVAPVPADALDFLARAPTGSAADTPSAAAYGAWSPTLQSFYFEQKASGSPPALFLPNSRGGLSLLTLGAEGEPRVSDEPDQFWANLFGRAYNGKAPQSPAARDLFSALDPVSQSYYFAQKASGTPAALVLADGAGQVLALAGPSGADILIGTPSDQFWADLTGASFGAASPQDAPTLADFVSGGPAAQAFFLARKGIGSPETVLLADGGGADNHRLASLGSGGSVSISASEPVPGFAAALSAAPNGAKYDPATLEQFQGWPAAYQAYYLAARGGAAVLSSSSTPTPDGVRQASLSASGAVVLSPVRSASDIVGTTTSAPSAAAVQAQAQAITADLFSTWPLPSQVAYLQSRGGGSPPALLMPTAGGGQALVSIAPGSNIVEITAPPDGFLTNLLKQPATGATLDTATLQQFRSWPNELQTYYLASKGTGSPPSLAFDAPDPKGGSQPVQATLSSDGASVVLTASAAKLSYDAPLLSAASDYPTADVFFSLTSDEQSLIYTNTINASHPSGVVQNGVLYLKGTSPNSPSPTIEVGSGAAAFKVAIPTSYQAYLGFAGGGVSGQDLATWPPQVQSAYVLQRSAAAYPSLPAATYPKVAVLSDSTVAIVPSAGAAASVVADKSNAPVGFGSAYAGATPAPTDFLLWPYACQLAWLRKPPNTLGTIVALGNNPNNVRAALNADGSGFQVAMATDLSAYAKLLGHTDPTIQLSDDERRAIAAGIDFSLFSKVASPQLQAQLLATLADPGSSPPIITLTKSVTPGLPLPAVISGGTAATGGGYTIEAAPKDYGTAPAALTPAAFMAWSPAVRESYALAQRKAPLYIGSGRDVLAVAFSPADGTLQITLPRTLGNTVTSGTVSTALAGTLLPYNYLPGSAVGTTSAINDAVSQALFPVLDGSGGAHNVVMSAQQASDFAKAPTALSGSTFAGWPSALQLQYLRVWQSPGTPLTIGSGADSIDVLMQTTATAGAIPKVYTVQNLQKADIGQMSYADQATLARSKAFTSIANGLGLIPDDGSVAALGGRDAPDPNAGLTSAAKVTSATPALSAFGYVQTMFTTALNTIDNPTLVAPKPGLPDGNMPAADRKVFEDEVNLLRKQTFGSPLPTSQQNQSSGQAIFSPKDIQDKLTAIIQRFTRANAFSSVANSKTATAGYFQIQNMTGSDPADQRLKYIYNPDGKTENAVEGDLGYYLLGDDRYRVPDRTAQYPDPQDYFQSRLASAFSSYSSQLPTGFGVPFTLSGMGLTLSTTNHDNGVDSNGNYPAGDSMTIDTMTIQRIDGGVKDNWIQEHETDGSHDDGAKNVYNTFSVNGVTYEIMSMSGSKLSASNNVPSTFSSLASSTYESNFHPYTENLSDFEGKYDQSDDGKAVLDYINGLMNDPTLNYKDGNPHTITIQSPTGLPISSLNLGGFNVYNVTVRYVPAAASTDNNATIDSGYQTFMAQEKSVLDLANRADQLATSGRIGGTQQNLDVPNLVYLFMMYTNLTGEAVLRADTEEVNQTNAVLNEYAIMQKIINQTVAAIKPGSNGTAGSGPLKGSNPDGSFTAQDMGALAMFTHGNSTAGTGNAVGQNPPLSPIELLQSGFTRPYLSHGIDYDQASSQWSSDGTSLSDAVTQLNQASQLKMNDINSETKQKDREFDLANTALQKMSDIVNKIAASI